jgi:hypothetical protein
MSKVGRALPMLEAKSSDVMDFNLALPEEDEEGDVQQLMPQLLTTGLDSGEVRVLLMNAVVGEEAVEFLVLLPLLLVVLLPLFWWL